jgi:hypothetical protein
MPSEIDGREDSDADDHHRDKREAAAEGEALAVDFTFEAERRPDHT